MDIQKNLLKIKNEIPSSVRLVVVSKTRTVNEILSVYQTGHKIFGENKTQELIRKQPSLPPDIEWHFIGHLQSNKVKYIAPYIKLIHSVDSLKLLNEINKQALKNNRIIDCLMQFHIATEESKFGLDLDEAIQILESDEFHAMKSIKICGVMGMATFTDNRDLIKNEFNNLRNIFSKIKTQYFADNSDFREISMGMSDDYRIAIDEGCTIVRIGNAIFGERNYS